MKLDEFIVGFALFVGEAFANVVGEEPEGQGVAGGDALAFGSARSGGENRVAAIGRDLFGCGHWVASLRFLKMAEGCPAVSEEQGARSKDADRLPK
jgi:hypothetical protein